MDTQNQQPRVSRRDAIENRQAILDAARAALPADPDASIETIAALAGLSRRAVYGHFPSRDDLVQEVVTAGAARILNAMPPHAELAPLPPAARIAQIAAALWTEVSHVRSLARIAVHGPLAPRISNVFAPLRAEVLEACTLGIADGSMRTDVSPDTLTRLIEGACLTVLDEATTSGTPDAEGHTMIVISALGIAGIDWHSSALTIPTSGATA